MKCFIRTCAILMAVFTLCACEGPNSQDPREAFVGDYTFTSTGQVDLYAGSFKFASVPMDEKGELSIALATKTDEVWIIAENDTTPGHVSGNNLFMDPATVEETFGEIVMTLAFTYGKATLNHDTLSFPTNVVITATYQDKSLSPNGQVDIVAIKKQ